MASTAKPLDTLLEERQKQQQQQQQQSSNQNPTTQTKDATEESQAPTAPLPPTMAKARSPSTSVDELIREMKKVPLFMTSMDDLNAGAGGENDDEEENPQLEALRALAYEGTRAEIAQNFREQGTELVKFEKRYKEAREYYSRALTALKTDKEELKRRGPQDEEEVVEGGELGMKGPRVVEIKDEDEDGEAEMKKEREIEEVCLVNRALCNLEMKNYGACTRDCAAALALNPRNIKAWYRAASACFALDKLPEARDAISSGLSLDPSNTALLALQKRCTARQETLTALATAQREREERAKASAATLKLALRSRGITTRTTERPPEVPESAVALAEEADPTSKLSFPVLLLYPAHAQTDFIKAFAEDEALGEHLEYIFPLPWDEKGEYGFESVEAYMETAAGGLVKVGKKVLLGKVLGGGTGKVEVVDGLVKINVLPKDRVETWIEEFKTRRGKS